MKIKECTSYLIDVIYIFAKFFYLIFIIIVNCIIYINLLNVSPRKKSFVF